MKIYHYLLCIIILTFVVQAQESKAVSATDTIKKWTSGGFLSINFNQIAISNWAKGGESSYSAIGLIKLFGNYKTTDQFSWINTLDLGYGIIKSDEYDLRKNEDKIDFNSTVNYKALTNINYTGIVNFKSQFANGYNYPNDSVIVSKYFSPAYLIISAGMQYNPYEWISLYLSPVTGKLIFVSDDSLANKGTYTSQPAKYDTNGNMVEEGKKFYPNFGAMARLQVKAEVFKNVLFDSKLDLFNNYTDINPDNRANIDVNWETTVLLKINSFLTASIFLHLIYDHDVKVPIYDKEGGQKVLIGEGPRLQTKESLGIGVYFNL